MSQNLVRFDSWAQVLEAARAGVQLWYEAPMDAARAYPAEQVAVRKVFKNGKLRIDPLSNQAGPFTADAGHLYRFRRRPAGSDVVITRHHRIYRIQWCRNGYCYVTSTVNGDLAGAYVDGKWDDAGKLPEDVRLAAEQCAPSATGAV